MAACDVAVADASRRAVWACVCAQGGEGGSGAGGRAHTKLSAEELMQLLRGDYRMESVPQSGMVTDQVSERPHPHPHPRLLPLLPTHPSRSLPRPRILRARRGGPALSTRPLPPAAAFPPRVHHRLTRLPGALVEPVACAVWTRASARACATCPAPQMLEQLLDREHLLQEEGSPTPYASSGVGYEVVTHGAGGGGGAKEGEGAEADGGAGGKA